MTDRDWTAAMREAVLRRGVRADEAAPGSGLGLAIVRDLAAVYGGRSRSARRPKAACGPSSCCAPADGEGLFSTDLADRGQGSSRKRNDPCPLSDQICGKQTRPLLTSGGGETAPLGAQLIRTTAGEHGGGPRVGFVRASLALARARDGDGRHLRRVPIGARRRFRELGRRPQLFKQFVLSWPGRRKPPLDVHDVSLGSVPTAQLAHAGPGLRRSGAWIRSGIT